MPNLMPLNRFGSLSTSCDLTGVTVVVVAIATMFANPLTAEVLSSWSGGKW